MSTVAIDLKQFIQEYVTALSGQPKTETLIDRYVSDPKLKEHILQAEAAFPDYEFAAHQVVADGDLVAVRATFRGVHKGEFAGIAPTGKNVSGEVMIFYRINDGRIAEHWMQWDIGAVIAELKG